MKAVKRERPAREILTPDELATVLEAAREPERTIFRVAAFTGLRRGELLGLQWGDVELDKARLHVRRSFGPHGYGAPKSAAGRRVVPLTAGLVAELRAHHARGPVVALDPEPDALVFPSAAGTPIAPRTLEKRWARALRQAGVRHLPLHSLRHFAASALIASGANVKTVQAIIGHASAQLTLDVYGHLFPDDLDQVAVRLGALLDGPPRQVRRTG